MDGDQGHGSSVIIVGCSHQISSLPLTVQRPGQGAGTPADSDFSPVTCYCGLRSPLPNSELSHRFDCVVSENWSQFLVCLRTEGLCSHYCGS